MSLPYIVIEGRVVRDAELRFTKGGAPIASLRIAASDSKKVGDQWETTEQLFVSVSVFENAERVAEQAVKGARVTAAGRLYVREYEHNGEKRSSVELKYPMVKVVEERNQGGQPAPAGNSWGAPAGQSAADPWATTTPTDQPPF